jgi:hypothetical protein
MSLTQEKLKKTLLEDNLPKTLITAKVTTLCKIEKDQTETETNFRLT